LGRTGAALGYSKTQITHVLPGAITSDAGSDFAYLRGSSMKLTPFEDRTPIRCVCGGDRAQEEAGARGGGRRPPVRGVGVAGSCSRQGSWSDPLDERHQGEIPV